MATVKLLSGLHQTKTTCKTLYRSYLQQNCRYSTLTPWRSGKPVCSSNTQQQYTKICRHFRQKKNPQDTPGRKSETSVGFRNLIRPLGFTVIVSGSSFMGCAVWQYETLRNVVQNAMRRGHDGMFQASVGKEGSFRHEMNALWNRLRGGEQVVACIIGINLIVYGLWKVPALQRFMITFFSSSPASGAPSLSMLFSMFSHYSLLHMAANMYVLWSFSSSITGLLGKEQFLAFFLSAGMISGFASHIFKVARGLTMVPSLGASGAIMGVLGAVCSQHPDAQLSIVFIGDILPISFSADTALKCIIALDLVGVLRGWKLLDHAAHLGGMFFGLWYINYGHKLIWANRETFIQRWHKFRGNP